MGHKALVGSSTMVHHVQQSLCFNDLQWVVNKENK